jgi:hypothetical protein
VQLFEKFPIKSAEFFDFDVFLLISIICESVAVPFVIEANEAQEGNDEEEFVPPAGDFSLIFRVGDLISILFEEDR